MRASSFAASSFVALFVFAGCAHTQQAATLTSTSAPIAAAAPAAPPPAAPAPAAPAAPAATEDATEEQAAPAPKKKKKTEDAPLSFEQLSAQLGADNSMGLDSVGDGTSEVPTSKGLSGGNYGNSSASMHQAVTEAQSHKGDVKVSGGITVAQVRDGVRGSSDRLRICYERGLAGAPHLAGEVSVRFSIDAQGTPSNVETESDAIPADVQACVRDVFASMTFAPPKQAPAKVVYPVSFHKD